MQKLKLRKMTILIAAGVDKLTEDLFCEVLLRLPMKDLLRLKSVSKSWFGLISSHRFAKSHLDRTITSAAVGDNDDETLIVHLEKDSSYSLFHVGSGEIVKNLKFPYSRGEYSSYVPTSARLLGSDCGIVCVSVEVSTWAATRNKFDIYLWNPATKQSKLIPRHTTFDDQDCNDIAYASLACGFDHIDFDFKVVRVISQLHPVQVYSSNKNAWRKIEPGPTDTPFANDCNVCLHGFLCGAGFHGMMAFDLNKEVFICDVELPVDDASEYFRARITNFQDSIAVIPMFEKNIRNGKINLWTLDDETCLRDGGVKASWTMMLSIDAGVSLLNFDGVFNKVEFLLGGESGKRLLYNSETKVARYVPNIPCFEPDEVFKYTVSLFSVAGFKRIRWADDKEVEDDSGEKSTSSESTSHSGG